MSQIDLDLLSKNNFFGSVEDEESGHGNDHGGDLIDEEKCSDSSRGQNRPMTPKGLFRFELVSSITCTVIRSLPSSRLNLPRSPSRTMSSLRLVESSTCLASAPLPPVLIVSSLKTISKLRAPSSAALHDVTVNELRPETVALVRARARFTLSEEES